MMETTFPHHLAKDAVKQALAEDLGLAGDITGQAAIAADESMTCVIRSRQNGIIAGLPLAVAAFLSVDEKIRISRHRKDGEKVRAGDIVLELSGNSRAILAAERVALNFLGHLSGVASLTAQYVKRVKGTGAAICCTRKTLPGLRAFQKYAVRAGGGQNHRFGLDQAVLVKDNHIASVGDIGRLLQRLRRNAGHMVRIEIEVDHLEQLRKVLEHENEVDAVLLDNMDNRALQEAVALVDGRLITEASGGVGLDTVGAIARTGVDLVSVGALTHSAPVFDLGLDFHTELTR